MNFMLLPNFFLGLLRLFYLYFYQIPLKKLDTKKFPKHIVLEIEREYRHKNYFKFYNQDYKKKFLLFNVFKVDEFTKVIKVSLTNLLYFFLINCKFLKKTQKENSEFRLLIGESPSSSLATYCYFCALFKEIKIIQPDSLVFHGGAALAAKAAKDQGLKTYWLTHGTVNPSNYAIKDSDVIHVYSEEEKKYLENKSLNSEIKLYPINKVKRKSRTAIIFLGGDKTKEEEKTLKEIIDILKTHEYKIIFKTHPTFLTSTEPDLYIRLRTAFQEESFLSEEIDTEELLLREEPSFVITWLSTAACISLRSGVIPICIEQNESASDFYDTYPFKKRTIYWKEESFRLIEILSKPEEYQKNLDLLMSR